MKYFNGIFFFDHYFYPVIPIFLFHRGRNSKIPW